MESVYIIEPGCYLRKTGGALNVCRGKKVVEHIPAAGLKKLVLVGWISLTGGVLDFLIRNKVETVFLTATGRFRTRLGADTHRHVALRKAQYQTLGEESSAAPIAAKLVVGKLENMARFLIARGRRYDDEALRVAAVRIRSISTRCQNAGVDLAKIRGLEGAGTRIYYGVFNSLIKNPAFKFPGRNRRPPLDPVNALLSFIYTLLTNEVLSAVTTSGMDPFMGSLHEVSYGRPSLACDLVEEYRCILGDRLVLGLLNRKMLTPDDFIYRKHPPKTFVDETEMKAKRPVEMKPAVLRTFISAYEKMMAQKIQYPDKNGRTAYRYLIHGQAAQFAAALTTKENTYKPYTPGH